jgi:predicted nuclease with TOPRIM domain
MKFPLVTRSRYDEMKEMLEDRIDDLQNRFDALQAKADALAASIIESDKEEEEKQEEPIGFAPKISDIRNLANGWAAQRYKESKRG